MKVYNNRNQAARSIRDIIGEITGDPVLTKGIAESRVIKSWELVVGTPVARLTTRINIYNGILHVSLNSSVIRSELLSSKDKVIERLNSIAGYNIIKDLVIM